MSKKILLAGDSWGVGVWAKPPAESNPISHGGVAQFLTEAGHDVTNLSIGGASNIGDILRFIRTKSKGKYDFVFVIATDPNRDVRPEDFWKKEYGVQDYINRHTLYLKSFIQQLDSLDRGPIYLLGGLVKLDNDLVQNTSIKIAMPSILEFLEPNLEMFDIFFTRHTKTLQSLDAKNILSDDLINYIYKQTKRWDQFAVRENIMGPDAVHPGLESHRKIADFLLEDIINASE